jgi:methionyl-tRNA synthetase
MDLRTGTIIAAEAMPKAKKLLKLTVDTGLDQRTVVSGIAEHYKPENIIGQKVVMLINLIPRELRGVSSQGMILMAENSAGKLCFVSPDEAFHNGSEVK